MRCMRREGRESRGSGLKPGRQQGFVDMGNTGARLRNANPMWVYERNFALLTRLVPKLAGGEEGDRALLCGEGERLQLSLLEHHKYTSLIGLQYSLSKDGAYLPDLHMTVRIYYDAQLVEVISYQDLQRILAEYPVQNDRSLYRDEKRQANLLLHELLWSLLVAEGRSATGANGP